MTIKNIKTLILCMLLQSAFCPTIAEHKTNLTRYIERSANPSGVRTCYQAALNQISSATITQFQADIIVNNHKKAIKYWQVWDQMAESPAKRHLFDAINFKQAGNHINAARSYKLYKDLA